MVDFSKLLQKPAGESKKPSALIAGDYPGIVKAYELGDKNKNKTPYVRFTFALTAWPDGTESEDMDGVDLAKRTLRRDFFLTEDSLWRLDEFITSLGVEPSGRSYSEILPELIGNAVLVEVQQYISPQSGDVGNQVGKVVGA